MARLPTSADTPETVNNEQEDSGQAQDVAADALDPTLPALGESRHGGPSDPTRIVPEDEPDLVDRLNAMVRSGVIDNDAFAGEPDHDDEEGLLGNTDEDDEGLLSETPDGGDDPLGDVASEWGLEDGTDPDPMNGGEDDDSMADWDEDDEEGDGDDKTSG